MNYIRNSTSHAHHGRTRACRSMQSRGPTRRPLVLGVPTLARNVSHAAGRGAHSAGRGLQLCRHKVESDVEAWDFGFQVNERQLAWDDAAARQLIKLILVDKLHMGIEEVEQKLSELACLVPDMVGKLERMRADILVQMLNDLPGLTVKLLAFRELLPGINISQLVARWPYLALEYDGPSLSERLQVMRAQLPGVRVEALVDAEPMFLKADIPAVLGNIRRVMPQSDPVQVLVSKPQLVLDMTSAGMTSALDVEGFQPKARN